jgi:molybdopterin-guanine dinucleotide biosynthesis protein A
VPRIGGEPQLLHARYDRAALPVIERCLARGDRSLRALVQALGNVCYLDDATFAVSEPTLTGFTNVNTVEELERARAIARRSLAFGDR